MWDEISRVLKYLFQSREGKNARNIVLLIITGAVVFLALNRFVINDLIHTDYLFRRIALARLLILNNISPYSVDIVQILTNYFSTRPIVVSLANFKFADPIFQLFVFFPFSFITDPQWAVAVFLSISQGFLIWTLEIIYQLLDWQPDWKIRLMNIGLAFFSYLGISFFLSPDLTVVQFFFFILGLKFSLTDKPIPGGFLLALSLLSFPMITLPLFLTLAFFIAYKKPGPVIWFGISFILLSLAGIIFDNNWPLKMVRNFFIEPKYFPFISFNSALGISARGAILPAIINSVPVILFILIVLEWLRMPKRNKENLFWLLSFMISVNPLLTASVNFQPTIISLFIYIFTIFLWVFHSEGNVKNYLLGLSVFLVIFLPGLGRLFPSALSFLNLSTGFNILIIILAILMLYWVRWWILESPLESENFEE